MNNYFDDFRMNIKYYREKLGISQTRLSILCDCGTGTIGGIESGKTKPSFDMMVRIADAFEINPADLFIRDSSKNKMSLKCDLQKQFEKILAEF